MLINLMAESPPSIFSSSRGKTNINNIKPNSGLEMNKRDAGRTKILAIAMMGETLTNKYELVIAKISEPIRMPESIKREYDNSKFFQ